jgi:hypothetical protein
VQLFITIVCLWDGNRFLKQTKKQIMKKTVLALVTLVCLTTAATAQKGSILLYGNVGFNTNSNGGDQGANGNVNNVASTGSFSINPGIGYQLNSAWTVGVEGGYNYADNGVEGISKTYKAGAFLRDAQHLAGIFSIYEQLGIGYQGATDAFGTKASGFYATVTPAIYADVKNGFGLNFSVGGLGYSSLGVSGQPTGSTFGLTFGKTLSIGLSKNFGGK